MQILGLSAEMSFLNSSTFKTDFFWLAVPHKLSSLYDDNKAIL